MADAGEVRVGLTADTRKFQNGINTANSSLKKFGQNARNFVNQNALVIGAGVGIFVAGVAKVAKAASDMEEAQSKFNVVFRGSTEVAEQFATVLQESYALSGVAAKTFLASIQDTLVPMGVARDEATLLSGEIIKLAADLGSFNNVPTATVVRDLQSALVGNTETVKKYGVVLRASDIEQRALADSGKKSAKQLTQQEKVMAAYKIILEGTEDAQGDMIRTQDSFANRQKKLQGRFEDLMVTIGNFTIGPGADLLTIITGWVETLDQAVQTIQEAIIEFGSFGEVIKRALIEAFRSYLLIMFDVLETMTGLGFILRKMGVDLDGVKGKINSQIDRWQMLGEKSVEAGQKSIEVENEKKTTIINNIAEQTEAEKKAEEEAKKMQEERIERDLEEIKKKKEQQKEFADFMMVTTDSWLSFANDLFVSFTNQFGQGFADMVLEGRKFSDVMKSIWKDLARQVIAAIGRMIAKWLAFLALRGVLSAFGGPAGAALATTIAAGLGGAAEGGLIGEPSIVTGLRTGKQILAGESGNEAIVPMSGSGGGNQVGSEFAEAAVAQNGGGGGITINISGTFVEGSRNKWQRLTREVIIPELRRFTMGNPTGPINRRKGVT